MITTTRKSLMILKLLLLVAILGSCDSNQTKNSSIKLQEKSAENSQNAVFQPNTLFEQTHSNLDGMVTEFVRKIYQDQSGNIWFGTNANGIIAYRNNSLKSFYINEDFNKNKGAVRAITEDHKGQIWFATSNGLIKFDGENFTVYSEQDGLPFNELWSVFIDKNGLIWLGSTKGIYQFNGDKFSKFNLPQSEVKNPLPMLANNLVFKFLEDRNGTLWLVVDGNGIYKYENENFTQLTKETGLTDNNIADIFEDRKGNIWIGSFNGGVSKYDGQTFTNFTKDGIIDGNEVYNFFEDHQENIWFSAENYGVYRYDGKNFKQFPAKDGLATNTIQSIFEDNKKQIWFGTWQGLSLYDGNEITDAKAKEPWVK